MSAQANPPGGEGHTPGPWAAEGDRVRDRVGLRVADCYADWKPDNRVAADAALIAAAPDLFEALDQLLDDMGEDGLCVCQAAKDMARAAILRATARTKE